MVVMGDMAGESGASSAVEAPDGLRVFISYSRKDAPFTYRLADSLAALGYAPDFDQATFDPDNITRGIAAEDEWWQRLQQMIAECEVMVFIVSPDSAASKVCDEEIAYARALGKRIIPILRRPIDFSRASPRLAALNVKIRFVEDDEPAFEAARKQLRAALDVDVGWHRESGRLVRLSRRWDMAGRPEDLLLGAADVRAVGELLERRPREASPPPAVLLECRDASRARHEEEDKRRRRVAGRAFVKPAENALAEGDYAQALRLAAAGAVLAGDLDFVLVPELWSPISQAAFGNRLVAGLYGHEEPVMTASFCPRGTRVVTGSADRTARIWDSLSGTETARLEGHADGVCAAIFSPDGALVLTASWDHTARLWDSASGRSVAVLAGHGGKLKGASFSPNGKVILTWSEDGTARVWHAASGAMVSRLEGHTGKLSDAALSPDGTRVMTVSGSALFYGDDTVRLWDVMTGREIYRLAKGEGGLLGGVSRASFDPDGVRVVTASGDKAARIWDAMTGRELVCLAGHEGAVERACFSPDGCRVATAGADGTARVWNAATGEEIARFSARGERLGGVTFCFGGGRVITTVSADKSARIFDAASGQEIIRLGGHSEALHAASFSPDGRRAVTASVDRTALVWDTAGGQEICRLTGHKGRVESAAFDPTGARIVTASRDGTARVWNVMAGRETCRVKGRWSAMHDAAFSPDGARIVTASQDKTARVWDAATGQEIVCLKGHGSGLNCASFSPDGRRVVTASGSIGSGKLSLGALGVAWPVEAGEASADHSARIWKVESGREAVVLDHAKSVNDAAFSPDGARVATASEDLTARVWDAVSGAEIACMAGHRFWVKSVAYSPDGGRIATGSWDHTARVWDAAAGRELALLEGHGSLVNCAAFSPCGQMVATASEDKTARVWALDAAPGPSATEIARLVGHQGGVSCAAFSPDGGWVVTSSEDGTARVWDLSRTRALVGRKTVSLAAALACGVGRRRAADDSDLLLGEAPADLFEAVCEHVDASAKPELTEAIAILRAPLHPHCYLSPSELAARFAQPVAAEKTPDPPR